MAESSGDVVVVKEPIYVHEKVEKTDVEGVDDNQSDPLYMKEEPGDAQTGSYFGQPDQKACTSGDVTWIKEEKIDGEMKETEADEPEVTMQMQTGSDDGHPDQKVGVFLWNKADSVDEESQKMEPEITMRIGEFVWVKEQPAEYEQADISGAVETEADNVTEGNVREMEHSRDSSFSRARNLKVHKGMHTGEKPHTCDVCGSGFRYSSRLKSHMRSHNGEKPYACDVCGSSFSRSEYLRVHTRIHTGEKPYTCDVCGFGFKENSKLNIHKRLHSGQKPYACDACEYRFNKSADLKKHKRVHSGERPYACDICECRFADKSTLTVHKRKHTGEKPYACAICGSRFTASTNLRQHERVHRGKKPCVCNVCGSRFTDSGALEVHKRTHSGTDVGHPDQKACPSGDLICVNIKAESIDEEVEQTEKEGLKEKVSMRIGEFVLAKDDLTEKELASSFKARQSFHNGEKPKNCACFHSKFADSGTRGPVQ